MKDLDGIQRSVIGYDKTPDENGDQFIKVKHTLSPIELNVLQSIFGIEHSTHDPVDRYLINCYAINQKQAEKLQPYVKDGVIDLTKYDFILHCSQTSSSD